MTEPTLVRTRRVLTHIGETSLFVQFGHPTDDGDLLEDSAVVAIAHRDWDELGRPEEITVTIEGGDLLNG